MLGVDGLLTLLLSNLLLLVTFGLTLLPLAQRVYRIARRTSCRVPEGDLLVVLGARLEQGQIPPAFRQRLDRAVALRAETGPIPILILGGITPGSTRSEADSGRSYLLDQGLSADSVLIEDQSRNTLENLKHARPMISERARRPVLISNRFHLARCAALARGIGLEHRLCAAEESLLVSVPFMLRLVTEAYYLHWYEVGRRWARLTRNRKSLERIS
jgi:uncharacterized SAM-binding protein YcdF (DUF218 family)